MAKDFAALLRKFKGLPKRLEQNVKMAVAMAATEAVVEAKTHHLFVDRTGILTNSIDSEGPTGSLKSGSITAILTAGAPYALWVGKGTKPHKIRAKFRKALRFPAAGGGFRFAGEVNHPGTKATLFLENAVEKSMARLNDELLPDAVELSFAQSGFLKV